MKQYILYGTRFEGEKFLYQNLHIKDDIEYCIDAFHQGGIFTEYLLWE